MGCYWIRKLQACFFSDDYPTAMAATAKAETFLWTLVTDFERAEYEFYGALTRAAICDQAGPDQRRQHLDVLSQHHRQIMIWENSCPENFGGRAALLGAEIARLEGRELDAEQLFESAVKTARANGFVDGTWSCGLSRMEARAGERVSEMKAEMNVETAMVSAN